MIRGRTVTLVPLARRHVERTRAWANDPELMRLLDRTKPVSADEHERWFSAQASASDRLYMAIETNEAGRHIGNIWLWAIDQHNRKAELRIVIGAHDYTGRGTGPEAIDLICRHAFDHLHLRRVYAYVMAFNGRARRAFEKAGFATEGVLRADRTSEGSSVDVFALARLAELAG